MQELANFSLTFSNYEILLPLILIGFIFYPESFLTATLLLFLNMIFNPLLKAFFNVPFPPELVAKLGKEGLSFPSGHMQSSTAFYGWILLTNNNKIILFILSIIILGIGFGLIYNGYHNIYDVYAGMAFAYIMIAIYYFIQQHLSKNKITSYVDNKYLVIAFITLFISCFLLLMIGFFYEIPIHSITALYVILGINLGFIINKKLVKQSVNKNGIFVVIIILFLIYHFLENLIFIANNPFFNQLKWTICSMILPISSLVFELNSTLLLKSDFDLISNNGKTKKQL